MAKFLYSMQNVLDIKERLETQAKTEYAALHQKDLILWKCADVMRQLILSRTR